MRSIYTLLIAILLIGGTYAYIQFAESVRRPPSEITFKQAAGITSVEIRRSFDCFANPDFDVDAVKIEFNGQAILSFTEDLPASEELIIESLAGVEEGENEIIVYGNSESADAFLSEETAPTLLALMVRVKFDDDVIAEKQFVSEANESWVGGMVSFKVPKTTEDSNQGGHQH